jgi:hypothetical protein
MKKLLWGVIALALVVWSGLAWVAHSLVGWGGSVASGNADIVTLNPEAVEWLSWLALFGTGVGEWLVVGVWAIGVVVALLLGAFGSRFLPQLSGLAQKLRTNT